MDTLERVTDWNPAAADLFGYSAEEAVGRPVDELVFGSSAFDSDEGREITREALATGRAKRITQRRRRDGTLVDVELLVVPLTADGSHAGLLAIYHDVTELQRARQEAEAATQAKSAFLATMSHEIRTPMNAVIGMTDLLLGTDLTGEQREFAEVVHSSGDLLLHVIDDILDYSKIEAGKLDLERAPFNLRDCVEGALDIVAPRAWEKELELACLIDEAAPAGIVGDEARMRQVLLNLLSNAVKFTDRGEVVVHVDAEETGAGSYRVELAVRDTGIGIPPDRMDRLFTSFSQVDASTTRRFGGTGLGLAISKRLVDLMGGTISVESEQKKGSTFRISLPVAAADVPTKIPLDEGLPHLAGKRILIVDDNATNREIVTRHARSWGMVPVAVELPVAALELIAKGEQFDVAVLDMMMPEMDGLALAGEIRQHRDEPELPLLLLTSLGRMPQLQSGGVFSAQLAKPLKASQLYNTLVQLLTASRAGEEEVEAVTNGQRARSDPARRRQPDEPEGGAPPAGAARLQRRRRDERARGDRGARAPAVRRRAHGRPDAASRRPRCHPPDLRALAGGEPSAHRRDDGERTARGPRGVLRRRHERLRRKADPRRGARSGAEAREAAHERRRRLGSGGARQPRRRCAREPA
jgi:PAS domain S-box-containing protein